MIKDIEKIRKAKDIIRKLANGIDPINGGEIENDSILSDPRMIRYFFLVSEVLEDVIKGEYSKAVKNNTFIITPEQKGEVVFPEGNIGVNDIAKSINQYINPLISKKVTGNLLNRGLKRMGILTEVEKPDGGKRTAINELSQKIGFNEVKKSYEGKEYIQVVANDSAKNFVLDNIESIMIKEN